MTTRILLLEDNPDDAELVQAALERAIPDLELRLVHTEREFRAQLVGFAPDVIVSDHNLPQYTGRQALDLARQLRPATPFILVTGSLDEETAVEYMKAGATDYLLKDRTARLGAAVLSALDQAHQRSALDWQQQLLQAVIDTDPSLIFVRDRDGRFVMCNRAMAAQYQRSAADLVGRRDADFNPLREEVETFLRRDREVFDTGEPRLTPEEPITNPVTGETRWFQTIKVPLTLPGHPEPLMLGVSTDITERRQLELQLRQSQKMEAIGQLAGGIAHDFNNVLTTIMGYAELLLANLDRKDPQYEDLKEIELSAQRAASLTRQLLAFSRRQVLEPKPINLNGLLDQMDRFLRRLIGEDIDLRTSLGSELWSVQADPGQIEQVVMNLVVNARDAMPRGGKLTIETANVELDEHYRQRHYPAAVGPHVMLAISDTGEGMDEATRARIFEPFFTTKPLGKGTGLGLSTVYGIVKQSGGTIWVYSEPGEGTTFKIYLPRTTDLPVATRPRDAEPAGGTETILLVEDEHSVRGLTAKLLRARGYTVREAGDAEEAERLFRSAGPVHLLLTDVVMPGLSGPDLALRLTTGNPDLRVLFMSGYTGEAVMHRGIMDARVAYLQKPFTPDALARKVREVLDQTVGR